MNIEKHSDIKKNALIRFGHSVYRKNIKAALKDRENLIKELMKNLIIDPRLLKSENICPLVVISAYFPNPLFFCKIWNVFEDMRIDRLRYIKYPGLLQVYEIIKSYYKDPGIYLNDSASEMFIINTLHMMMINLEYDASLIKNAQDREIFIVCQDIFRKFMSMKNSTSDDSIRAAATIYFYLYDISKKIKCRYLPASTDKGFLSQKHPRGRGMIHSTFVSIIKENSKYVENHLQSASRKVSKNIPKQDIVNNPYEFHEDMDSQCIFVNEYNTERVGSSGYIKDHCKIGTIEQPTFSGYDERLKEENFKKNFNNRYTGIIRQLNIKLDMLKPAELEWIHGEEDGQEINNDLLYDFWMDYKSKQSVDIKIFSEKVIKKRSVGVLLLLDNSRSTEEIVDKKNKLSILDYQKFSTIILSESLKKLGDLFGVYAISDSGFRKIFSLQIKDVKQAFDGNAVNRLIELDPYGNYSRIGAYIRYGSEIIKKWECKTKILLLFSDGNPAYFKSYSGEERSKTATVDGKTVNLERAQTVRMIDMHWDSYCIQDMKKAVDESRKLNVHPFCVSYSNSQESKDNLKKTFGDRFCVVNNIEELPKKITKIFYGLTK